MAPRTGPRGVTNQDVADRAGVSYVAVPQSSQPAPVDQSALLNYVLGGQAPGYGMKYGGFPTAGYGQAAIEGQAFGIADLARQAAQQAAVREQELFSAADRQLRPVESQTASDMRRAQRQASTGLGAGLYQSENPMGRYIGQKIIQSRFQDLSAQREAELERLQAPIRTQLESDIASQVEPAQQIAQTLGAFTPSQFAQQIAVSRYGYDPMLASGLFSTEMDLDYSDRVQQAQRQALGLGLSNDEYLFELLGPEGYKEYQQNKALQAYENVMQPDYDQQDLALYEFFGTVPSNEVEREIMLDEDFQKLVGESRESLRLADKAINPNAVVATIARNYMEAGGDPVRAMLLEDILTRYSFLVQPLGVNVDLPGEL